jgi:hypothetical protein
MHTFAPSFGAHLHGWIIDSDIVGTWAPWSVVEGKLRCEMGILIKSTGRTFLDPGPYHFYIFTL